MAEHAHASESEPYTEALQKLSIDVQRIVEATALSTSADSDPPSKALKAPQTIDPPMDVSMLYSASFMQKMALNAASNAHDVMQSISPNRVRRADEASSQSQLANPTYCHSSSSIDISNVDFVLPSTTASEQCSLMVNDQRPKLSDGHTSYGDSEVGEHNSYQHATHQEE
ncbi:MAG: hypothetical protein Q9164_001566 [Protoblastenia rupestris]